MVKDRGLQFALGEVEENRLELEVDENCAKENPRELRLHPGGLALLHSTLGFCKLPSKGSKASANVACQSNRAF